MKKIIGIALVAVLVIFTLASCGSNTTTPSTEPSASETSSAPADHLRADESSEAPASTEPETMTGAITVIPVKKAPARAARSSS